MKHWLIIGGMIIVSVVLLARSRIGSRSATTAPTTMPGISVDRLPAQYVPTTAPTTRPAGVTLDQLPQRYVPVPTH